MIMLIGVNVYKFAKETIVIIAYQFRDESGFQSNEDLGLQG